MLNLFLILAALTGLLALTEIRRFLLCILVRLIGLAFAMAFVMIAAACAGYAREGDLTSRTRRRGIWPRRTGRSAGSAKLRLRQSTGL
jgi:hypothetical protein